MSITSMLLCNHHHNEFLEILHHFQQNLSTHLPKMVNFHSFVPGTLEATLFLWIFLGSIAAAQGYSTCLFYMRRSIWYPIMEKKSREGAGEERRGEGKEGRGKEEGERRGLEGRQEKREGEWEWDFAYSLLEFSLKWTVTVIAVSLYLGHIPKYVFYIHLSTYTPGSYSI